MIMYYYGYKDFTIGTGEAMSIFSKETLKKYTKPLIVALIVFTTGAPATYVWTHYPMAICDEHGENCWTHLTKETEGLIGKGISKLLN